MVNSLDVAKGVINVVAGPGASIVIDAYAQSNRNNERDANLRKDADDYWRSDRQIIENEWGKLDPQYHQPAPSKILSPEAFETWSHEQIWNALNGHDGVKGVEQGDINAGADGWRRLTEQATNAINAFRAGVDSDIETLWTGRAANSAMEATRTYSDEFRKLTVSFQMVANGIDLTQGYLDQAKRSVAPPETVDALGEFLGHIPGNGVLKLSQHRANEAEAHAQDVMSTVYQPGVLKVDGRTPLLPEPYNPVHNSGDQPTHASPVPGSNPTSNYPTGPNPDGVNPTGPQPGDPNSSTAPNTNDQNTSNQTANQPDTNPANTSTPQTVPQNYLEDQVGRPNTPNPGSPHLTTSSPGSPSIPGMPAAPGPGKSIPGRPTGPTVPSVTGTGTGRPQTGRPGMPGFGMPPAARGKGDDDEEHKTPDYLVQDRTTELLGEQPRVLPPGGVIGG
ncbi:hypothetical protein [Nocardia sp. R6R-6]|uniref:hypothetical protein n=1 Tax=Nocardia sp. R6R-6 TaxID=3459303 RepID=UPI00403D6A74